MDAMMKQTTDIDNDLIFPDENERSDDESESGADSDFTGMGNGIGESKNDGAIARQETKAVLLLKLMVLLVLALSAIAVSYSVHRYTTGSEESQFEEQFVGDSNKVLEAIGISLDKTLGSFDSLAVTLVSSARAANETWPFVTLPDFAVRVSKILSLSDAFTINVLPIVTPEQRTKWATYSVQNDYWVNESMAIQETWDNYYGPVVYDWEPYGVIHGDSGDVPYNVRYVTALLPTNRQRRLIISARLTLEIFYSQSTAVCFVQPGKIFQ
jgi:hypothetical protein